MPIAKTFHFRAAAVSTLVSGLGMPALDLIWRLNVAMHLGNSLRMFQLGILLWLSSVLMSFVLGISLIPRGWQGAVWGIIFIGVDIISFLTHDLMPRQG